MNNVLYVALSLKMKIILVTILTILTLQSCSKLASEKRLEQRIKETVLSGKSELNLKELTDFKWDNLLIITPYARFETVERQFEINLDKVQDVGIESRDDIAQLVFLLNNNVVRTVVYPRYPGDFAQRGVGLKLISIDSAIFKIIVTDELNSDGNKWIKLIRK
jgi:hypothetical protein